MKSKKLVIRDSEELLENPKFVKAITKRGSLAEETAEILMDVRIRMGLTQSQLAKKIGTTQSVIARAESGRSLPGLSFIERIAKAYKTNVRIAFDSMPDVVPMAIRYAHLAKPKTVIPISSVAKVMKEHRVSASASLASTR
jgi:transcriptional regulator with XRE-family HTH domain